MLRYKEANRLLKAKEEELRMQLEDELHSSSGWKRDRERLESRVGKYNLRGVDQD
jgi:myosin protein heavy chain